MEYTFEKLTDKIYVCAKAVVTACTDLLLHQKARQFLILK